jgi:hypothetical protein
VVHSTVALFRLAMISAFVIGVISLTVSPVEASPVLRVAFDGVIPQSSIPDTTGAMGPHSYLEFVNVDSALFSRNGTLIDEGDQWALSGLGDVLPFL